MRADGANTVNCMLRGVCGTLRRPPSVCEEGRLRCASPNLNSSPLPQPKYLAKPPQRIERRTTTKKVRLPSIEVPSVLRLCFDQSLIHLMMRADRKAIGGDANQGT